MDSTHSARGSVETGASTSPAYGLAEYGAPWSGSDRVLITVHGRDRASDELPIQFLSHPISRVTRILAPYATIKRWYEGRYDAPRAENAPAVEKGLAQIRAAFALAAKRGIPASRIVLAGFSQGACMVVEYLLSGAERPGGAAVFTGSALEIARGREALPDLSGMPIVLSGGRADPWLPATDIMATGSLLEAAGANVQSEIFPDGEHVVRSREISLLGDLLQQIAA